MSDDRYYTDDDEHGRTLKELGAMSPDDQAAYVFAWWDRNFEDPAQETPYNSEEGGYLYIWGGPYSALEELEAEFSSGIPFERLEEFAREIESDGIVDWAPGRDHPDQRRAQEAYEVEARERDLERELKRLEAELERRGAQADGDDVERRLRGRLKARIDRLEIQLAELASAFGGMGHNQPPEGGETSERAAVISAQDAAAAIKAELQKTSPGPVVIAQSAGRLAQFLDWLRKKFDLAADEAVKVVGKGIGAAMLIGSGAALADTLGLTEAVVRSAIAWLHHLLKGF